MERVVWQKHKNKEILLGDYSNITSQEEYIKIIRQATTKSIKDIKTRYENPDHAVLMLIDIRDSIIGTETLSVFKENAKKIKPYIKKVAVLGIHGVRKILLESIVWFSGLDAKPFDSQEEAKDWLVSE